MNCVYWLPNVGDGIVYGTNRGDLHICRPGYVLIDPMHMNNKSILPCADESIIICSTAETF